MHGERIQELLRERRKERDKENSRQRESTAQLETTMTSREKIYKDRIRSLETQNESLKERLSKEMRSRQKFISGASAINQEATELRQNLDASLFTVAHSPNARLDAGLLDRESTRLSSAADIYSTRSHSHRRSGSHSRLIRTAGSVDNLNRTPAGPADAKRTLSFNTYT